MPVTLGNSFIKRLYSYLLWCLLYVTVSVLLPHLLCIDRFYLKYNAAQAYTYVFISCAVICCFEVSVLNPKKRKMICQPTRLLIYPGDVKELLNCSSSTASRKLKELREASGKKDHHEISIKEYCEYYDIEYADVCKFLKLIPAA